MKMRLLSYVYYLSFASVIASCSDNLEAPSNSLSSIETQDSVTNSKNWLDPAGRPSVAVPPGTAQVEVYYADEWFAYPSLSYEGPRIFRANSLYDSWGGYTLYSGSANFNIQDVKFGDFIGDGLFPGMVTAFNATYNGPTYIASIYLNNSQTYGLNNSTSIGTNIYYENGLSRIVGVCTGDFDGDGIDEIVAAFNNQLTGKASKILKKVGSNWVSIYSGSSYWSIAGLTATDTNYDGIDELITAFNSVQGPALYLGNGSGIGTKYYQGPSIFTIRAIAAGNFFGDKLGEVATAMSSSSYSCSIWVGTPPSFGFLSIYDAGEVAFLSAGKDENGAYKLITAIKAPPLPENYGLPVHDYFLGDALYSLGTHTGRTTRKAKSAGIRYLRPR